MNADILNALLIAKTAHDGQVDKGGSDYILHPLRIAGQLPPQFVPAALLHDVVEDSDLSLSDLRKLGVKENVIEAVKVLTKKRGSYNDYLSDVKENVIARCVKVFDLLDNMDLSRLPEVTERDLKRNDKYGKALDFLIA